MSKLLKEYIKLNSNRDKSIAEARKEISDITNLIELENNDIKALMKQGNYDECVKKRENIRTYEDRVTVFTTHLRELEKPPLSAEEYRAVYSEVEAEAKKRYKDLGKKVISAYSELLAECDKYIDETYSNYQALNMIHKNLCVERHLIEVDLKELTSIRYLRDEMKKLIKINEAWND
ncbi:MAG: hypothetical protein HUJ56_01360 [Erysipelotrichaceae bacterium]|nr:hypothetical protein [Erysipelotrichaceae bacterium]